MHGSITRKRLRELLEYDAKEGVLRWRVKQRNGSEAGSIAGCVDAANGGYRKIRIGQRLYLSHRLIWFMEKGRWPKEEIDHINGDRSDSRLENLRLATRGQNRCNAKLPSTNTSGAKGIYWDKQLRKWRARVKYEGRKYYFGSFASIDEAAAAASAGRAQLHGKYANHG